MRVYYIASLKLQGWFSKTGQYTTDLTQAKMFTHPEMLAMCKRQREGGNQVIPVNKSDMDEVGYDIG